MKPVNIIVERSISAVTVARGASDALTVERHGSTDIIIERSGLGSSGAVAELPPRLSGGFF